MRGSRWRRTSTAVGIVQPTVIPGLDSEFFAVLERLTAAHGPRLAHETPAAWLRRLALPATTALIEANRLHQRLRFDPSGLSEAERQRLRQVAAVLITEPSLTVTHSAAAGAGAGPADQPGT